MSYLPLNFGTTIGLQLRTSGETVSPKGEYRPRPGQVFSLWMGVAKTGAKGNRGYFLADTVVVGDKTTENTVLTKNIPKNFKDISQTVELKAQTRRRSEEEDSQPVKSKKRRNDEDNKENSKPAKESIINSSKVLQTDGNSVKILTRHQKKAQEDPTYGGSENLDEAKRVQKHQADLLKKLHEELKKRLAENGFIIPGTEK